MSKLTITAKCVLCSHKWSATDQQIEDAREAGCLMCPKCMGPAIVDKAELKT